MKVVLCRHYCLGPGCASWSTSTGAFIKTGNFSRRIQKRISSKASQSGPGWWSSFWFWLSYSVLTRFYSRSSPWTLMVRKYPSSHLPNSYLLLSLPTPIVAQQRISSGVPVVVSVRMSLSSIPFMFYINYMVRQYRKRLWSTYFKELYRSMFFFLCNCAWSSLIRGIPQSLCGVGYFRLATNL